jgi:hypothetical protein
MSESSWLTDLRSGTVDLHGNEGLDDLALVDPPPDLELVFV